MAETRVHIRVPQIPLLAPEGYRTVMQQQVGQGMQALVDEIADVARVHTPVGVSGILRASIATQVTAGRDASALVEGRVLTGKQAPYAEVVEEGRAPGTFPPRAPIELWAQRVLGDRRLWFVVARAIARRGTKGRHMFRDALALVRPKIQPTIEAAVARAAKMLQGGS